MINNKPKKLNASELNVLVKKLVMEAKSSSSDELEQLLPSTDKDLIDFASKVDDLLENFIKDAEKLREDGSNLVAEDILGSAKVGERNRFIMTRVGLIGKLKNLMIQGHEALKRES